MSMKMNFHDVRSLYQIKVSLERMKPPIWRRLIVPKTITLHQLHFIIQAAMGWSNMHLYCFRQGDNSYDDFISDNDPMREFDNTYSSRTIQLDQVLVQEKDKLRYDYDLGDTWYHIIVLEKATLGPQFFPHLPYCAAGRQLPPPEDLPPSDEEIDFDEFEGGEPPKFSLAEVNQRLSQIPLI